MEKKQLTSHNDRLSRYDYGVKYILQRRKDSVEIDADTANKLSQILLTNQELRFVKINTKEGTQIINVTDVIGIIPNEKGARRVMATIKDGIKEGREYKQIGQDAYETSGLVSFEGLGSRLTTGEFDELYRLAQEDLKA